VGAGQEAVAPRVESRTDSRAAPPGALARSQPRAHLPLLALLGGLAARVHTITSDNGHELAYHEQIASGLEAKFYFTHPYSSWERGLNENTNGLVRQYFPKKTDLSKITDRQFEKAEERLNNRPRKTLGYRTPNEVFFKRPLVALQT
jgi:IS30 family transposase